MVTAQNLRQVRLLQVHNMGSVSVVPGKKGSQKISTMINQPSVTPRRRSDTFEFQRRLSRVPWTVRRSKQSILKETSLGCSLEGLMLKLKLQYFGHLMRRGWGVLSITLLAYDKSAIVRQFEHSWHCLSLGLKRKLTFTSPVATAEFSKFAVILSAALSQHHLLGFELAQLEFHHLHQLCSQ